MIPYFYFPFFSLSQKSEETIEKKTDTKDETTKPESSTVEVDKDSEVVIDVERKISKDSLTSIKVIPSEKTDKTETTAVPLMEEDEESDKKSLEVKVEASEKKDVEETLNTSAVVELGSEVDSEKKLDNDQTKQTEEMQAEKNAEEKSVAVALEVEGVSDNTKDEAPTDNVDGKKEPFLEYEIDDELPWARYRSLDVPPSKVPVEEEDEWPQSEEDEDYGQFLYCVD